MPSYNIAELAQHCGAQLQGTTALPIDGVCTLQNGRSAAITFLANKQYRKYLADTQASAVILAPEDADSVGDKDIAALISDDPYTAYAKVAALFAPQYQAEQAVHPSAVVSKQATLGEGVQIGAGAVIEAGAQLADGVSVGAGAVIGHDVQIGANTQIAARVSLCHQVRIGQRCVIHSGAVIGSDGFGLARNANGWLKIAQLGSVQVGDDVEIGANTTIDRGAVEDTIIGNFVKLDNQIQIAHNVVIGDYTAIAACVGIAGSTHIGERCLLGGGVGVGGHLKISSDVILTGWTMVTGHIRKPGVYSSGISAEPNGTWRRNTARFHKLDQLAKRVRQLEKHVETSQEPE